MNAKITALFVLFLNFVTFVKAEIPGGIFYSDGRDAIYYDIATKESKNSTSDLSEAVVKDPFTVSENGTTLVWLQDSKFWLRELPMGTPRTIKVNRKVYKQ